MAPKHVYLFVLHDCLRIVNTKGLIVAQQRLDEIEFTGKTGPGKGDMLVMVTKDRETHHCHTIATPPGEATELLKAIKASLKARPVTPPRDTLQAQKKSSKGGGTPKRRPHKKEMTPDYNSRSRFEVDSEDGMEILRDCDYLEGMQARVSNWISEAGVSSGKVKRALLCAKSSRNNSPAHRGAAKIHASLMARLENEQAHTEDLLHGNANTPMMGPTDAHPTSPTHRVPSYSLSPTHRVSSGPQGETATPVPRKPVGMSEIDEQNVVRKQHFMHVPPITPPKATTLKQVSPRARELNANYDFAEPAECFKTPARLIPSWESPNAISLKKFSTVAKQVHFSADRPPFASPGTPRTPVSLNLRKEDSHLDEYSETSPKATPSSKQSILGALFRDKPKRKARKEKTEREKKASKMHKLSSWLIDVKHFLSPAEAPSPSSSGESDKTASEGSDAASDTRDRMLPRTPNGRKRGLSFLSGKRKLNGKSEQRLVILSSKTSVGSEKKFPNSNDGEGQEKEKKMKTKKKPRKKVDPYRGIEAHKARCAARKAKEKEEQMTAVRLVTTIQNGVLRAKKKKRAAELKRERERKAREDAAEAEDAAANEPATGNAPAAASASTAGALSAHRAAAEAEELREFLREEANQLNMLGALSNKQFGLDENNTTGMAAATQQAVPETVVVEEVAAPVTLHFAKSVTLEGGYIVPVAEPNVGSENMMTNDAVLDVNCTQNNLESLVSDFVEFARKQHRNGNIKAEDIVKMLTPPPSPGRAKENAKWWSKFPSPERPNRRQRELPPKSSEDEELFGLTTNSDEEAVPAVNGGMSKIRLAWANIWGGSSKKLNLMPSKSSKARSRTFISSTPQRRSKRKPRSATFAASKPERAFRRKSPTRPQQRRPKGGRARCKFSYTARSTDELSFQRGDLLEIMTTDDPTLERGWWRGALGDGQIGIFPANYAAYLIGEEEVRAANYVAYLAERGEEAEQEEVEVTFPPPSEYSTGSFATLGVEQREVTIAPPSEDSSGFVAALGEKERDVTFPKSWSRRRSGVQPCPSSEESTGSFATQHTFGAVVESEVASVEDTASPGTDGNDSHESQDAALWRPDWGMATHCVDADVPMPPEKMPNKDYADIAPGSKHTFGKSALAAVLSRRQLQRTVTTVTGILAEVGAVSAEGHSAALVFASNKALKFAEIVSKFVPSTIQPAENLLQWPVPRPLMRAWPGPRKLYPVWESVVGFGMGATKRHARMTSVIGFASLHMAQLLNRIFTFGKQQHLPIAYNKMPASLLLDDNCDADRTRNNSATLPGPLDDSEFDGRPRASAPLPLPRPRLQLQLTKEQDSAVGGVFNSYPNFQKNPLTISVPNVPFRTVALYKRFDFKSKGLTIVTLNGEDDAPFAVGEQIIEVNSTFVGPGVNVHELLDVADYPLYLKVVTQSTSFDEI